MISTKIGQDQFVSDKKLSLPNGILLDSHPALQKQGNTDLIERYTKVRAHKNMTALFSLDTVKDVKIAVIGLGYVGLPLAIAFAAKYRVLGFDIDTARISELHLGRCLGGKTGVRFRHPK